MEKKRKSILFVVFGLGIGGIEKCLVNLVNALPKEQFDIDVLLMNAQYDMKPQVKEHVHFLDEFTYVVLDIRTILKEMRSRGGDIRHVGKLFRYGIYRVADKLDITPWRIHRRLPKHYDIAVAYSQNGEAPYYVMDRVEADRKVLWYHNSLYEKTGKERDRDQSYYPRFDYVVPVSRDCEKELKKKLPFPEGKLVVLKNLCNSGEILEKSGLFTLSWGEGTHIVTVGRLTEDKGPEFALEALRILRKKGWNVIWHWVGDGDYADSFREHVAQAGLEDAFILEGNQKNPYPFILRGDIYVQPSPDEAYSTTVTEAKVLCRPIVVTDVGGMRDQLTDGETAVIVPVSGEAIARGIEKLLEDPELGWAFSRNLEGEDYSPEESLKEYIKTVFR